jgi:hypothetical protein
LLLDVLVINTGKKRFSVSTSDTLRPVIKELIAVLSK